MAYTASALAFLLADLPKPVVLTGAQIPLCEYSSDATNNFRGALLSAGMKDLPGTSGGRLLLRIRQGIIKKKALWADTLRCCIVWPMIRAEVCIFFNRKLMRGCRTRKVSSFEVDAFDSPLMKPLLIGESNSRRRRSHLTPYTLMLTSDLIVLGSPGSRRRA